MKLKSTLLAATLLVFAVSTATSFAVEEHHDSPAAKTDAAKAENGEVKKPVKVDESHDSPATKPAKKKVKKHSHVEEKTGIPMSEPAQHAAKEIPKNRHDHTQEKR